MNLLRAICNEFVVTTAHHTMRRQNTRGLKTYELTNHLGNVLATVTDARKGVDSDADGDADYYHADIASAADYYPFGFGMPERDYVDLSSEDYRFGFNGMENGIKENFYTTEFREYNSIIGAFLSLDPVLFPSVSPYVSFNNCPILFNDPNGDSSVVANNGDVIHHDPKDLDTRVFMKNGNDLTSIGELGGTIDIDLIFDIKLSETKIAATNEMEEGLMPYANMVKKDADWDLKNNENTVFGIAWAFDKLNNKNTEFTFEQYSFRNAADVGNFHAGYAGRFANRGLGIDFETLALGAGAVELKKLLIDENRYQDAFFNISIELLQIMQSPPTLSSPGIHPYGDNFTDYTFNRAGFLYGDNETLNDNGYLRENPFDK